MACISILNKQLLIDITSQIVAAKTIMLTTTRGPLPLPSAWKRCLQFCTPSTLSATPQQGGHTYSKPHHTTATTLATSSQLHYVIASASPLPLVLIDALVPTAILWAIGNSSTISTGGSATQLLLACSLRLTAIISLTVAFA